MSADFWSIAVMAAGLGSGLMAGVFFAFSSFVMVGLARLRPAEGVAAMQAINRTAVTPPFMALFFGAALACLVVLLLAAARWTAPDARYALLGSALYLAGAFGITAIVHVPRNNALMAVDGSTAEGEAAWERFVPAWTRWNHLRTLSAAGAAILLTLALVGW